MRTTIRLDDDLYRAVKERAARRGVTVGEVVADALRRHLSESETSQRSVPELPVFDGSGVLPGVDIDSNAHLRDALDEDEGLDALR